MPNQFFQFFYKAAFCIACLCPTSQLPLQNGLRYCHLFYLNFGKQTYYLLTPPLLPHTNFRNFNIVNPIY